MGPILWSFMVMDEAKMILVMQLLLVDDINFAPDPQGNRAMPCFCLLSRICNSDHKHDRKSFHVSGWKTVMAIISLIQHLFDAYCVPYIVLDTGEIILQVLFWLLRV